MHTFINWEIFTSRFVWTDICTGIKGPCNRHLNEPQSTWPMGVTKTRPQLGEWSNHLQFHAHVPNFLNCLPKNRSASWLKGIVTYMLEALHRADFLREANSYCLNRKGTYDRVSSIPANLLSSIHSALGAEDLKLEDQRHEPACLDPGSMVFDVGPTSNLSPALSFASE